MVASIVGLALVAWLALRLAAPWAWRAAARRSVA
jgi:hypothetical protein